jgi:hypothetical protein
MKTEKLTATFEEFWTWALDFITLMDVGRAKALTHGNQTPTTGKGLMAIPKSHGLWRQFLTARAHHTCRWPIVFCYTGYLKKCPWRPGSKQESALVNLVPRSLGNILLKHTLYTVEPPLADTSARRNIQSQIGHFYSFWPLQTGHLSNKDSSASPKGLLKYRGSTVFIFPHSDDILSVANVRQCWLIPAQRSQINLCNMQFCIESNWEHHAWWCRATHSGFLSSLLMWTDCFRAHSRSHQLFVQKFRLSSTTVK